jgi:Type I phosphodiesterase / nucleotide pyrophosphatase
VSNDPRVDELRQRLRSLGYLDAGVDRFVLGPARATRRPSAIAFLSSVRVGVVGALLLGPAAAIGLSARLPGLVTGPRDALVIALYLGAFFGLGITAAAFIAGLLVAGAARASGVALAQRARRLSRVAGVLVSLLCLGYLTLWWQTVLADVGWSAPVWTGSALAIAVAISLVLGHAVRLMSSAVIVASTGGAVEARRASWRASFLAGLVAFGCASLLVTWSPWWNRTAAAVSSALTVAPGGLRVRVIAIDGFDGRIFDDLSRTSSVTALSAAFQGAAGQLATREDPATGAADPARIWTTVATGQPPDVHGVHGLETRRVAGMSGRLSGDSRSPLGRAIRGATDLVRLTRPSVASGTERQAKTFWEVASDAGLRTVVVNWWATWPARSDAGTVLSDRAILRLEHGGALDAEISPRALYDELLRRWPELRSRSTAYANAALRGATFDAETSAVLQRSAELDAVQLALLSEVTSPVTDLSVVYLPGLDIAQHALLTSAQGSGASMLAARLEALRHYYSALDRMLASALTPEPGELVLVVTQPGRVSGASGARLSVRGAAISPGKAAQGFDVDVAPTILYALGVPIARDLHGSPMLGLFDAKFTDRPVRVVQTYGLPMQKPADTQGQPLDQEMIDRLRSLGYVR